MRRRSLFHALAVLLALSATAGVRAQENLAKGKLGYGFAPGLVAGKDFVAGQLIVSFKEGMSIEGLAQAAVATGGEGVKGINHIRPRRGGGFQKRTMRRLGGPVER